MNERQSERLRLLQGALTYRDDRLAGFDAAVLMEVIEHVEPRTPACSREARSSSPPVLRMYSSRPRTPSTTSEFETLPAGRLRHRDHRFEWTRPEFATWADGVAGRKGYTVRYLPIGPEDPEVGSPTQMAVFDRA